MLSLTIGSQGAVDNFVKRARAARDAVYIYLKHVSKMHGWNSPDRLIDYTIRKILFVFKKTK